MRWDESVGIEFAWAYDREVTSSSHNSKAIIWHRKHTCLCIWILYWATLSLYSLSWLTKEIPKTSKEIDRLLTQPAIPESQQQGIIWHRKHTCLCIWILYWATLSLYSLSWLTKEIPKTSKEIDRSLTQPAIPVYSISYVANGSKKANLKNGVACRAILAVYFFKMSMRITCDNSNQKSVEWKDVKLQFLSSSSPSCLANVLSPLA